MRRRYVIQQDGLPEASRDRGERDGAEVYDVWGGGREDAGKGTEEGVREVVVCGHHVVCCSGCS